MSQTSSVLALAVLFSIFASSIDAAPTDSMMAVACARNPSLSMCAEVAPTENAEFRARDAPEDVDTKYMRGFPKVSFDELQTQRYCQKHKEHYQHYCVGAELMEIRLQSKLLKFCPSFEKNCPEMASQVSVNTNNQQPSSEMFREASLPLVIPPALPSAPNAEDRMLFDLPLAEGATKPSETSVRPVPQQLSAKAIQSCTPDCTAPHCTVACKCANTHPSVHAKCNPPANAHMASTCQAWYSKCPMFKPVTY